LVEKIHKWTRRLLLGSILGHIPFYRIDYLSLKPLSFLDHNIEIKQRVGHKIFNYSPLPGDRLSVLFEGRSTGNTNTSGRLTPDIVRKPWMIGTLALETRLDIVERTYRTISGVSLPEVFVLLTVRPSNSTDNRSDGRRESSKIFFPNLFVALCLYLGKYSDLVIIDPIPQNGILLKIELIRSRPVHL
jgi:hypothetical protein